MRRTLVGVVALVLLAGTAASDGAGKKKDKSDKDRLQGTWEVTEFKAGKRTDKEESAFEVKAAEKMLLTFAGDKVTIKTGPKGKEEEATFVLNAAESPRQITIKKAEGKGKAELKEKSPAKDKGEATATLQGIYELKGDTLEFGFSNRGSRGERPADFNTAGTVIMILKKQKKS